MTRGPGDVAVIIVNYATAELAVEAVKSVLGRDHGGRRVEVHLVDNASPGNDAARFAEIHAAEGWGPRVVLHLEAENHGFGRGNNLVLHELAKREVPPGKVFLLNPDARLQNEAIDILAGFLEAHPEAGFAGAGVALPDGRPVTAAFRFPSPKGEFVRQVAFGPISRMAPHRLTPLPPDHPEGPVDWVTGAAVMIRFEALRELGFFDPAYFLYYEEVDLMHRGQRAGWQTWYVPSARVIHAEGASTNVKSGVAGRPRKPAYWYDSWHIYFRNNYGVTGARMAAFAWTAGAVLNHALALVPGRRASVPDHFFRDFWGRVGGRLFGGGKPADG